MATRWMPARFTKSRTNITEPCVASARAGDVNRQVRVQAVTVRQQREQFGKAIGFVVHGNLAVRFTVRFTMSGFFVLEVASVAVGRIGLDVRTICICRLIIMNDASRKNMMSISGMISSRDFFFFRDGRADFHGVNSARRTIFFSSVPAFGHERDLLDAARGRFHTPSPCRRAACRGRR
jgi:hypothetical protein